MSKKKKRGLRIGNYRITPLGLSVLAVLLIIIVSTIVFTVAEPFGPGVSLIEHLNPTPTPTPTPTPSPTPTPVPTPTPAPTPRSATIRSLGEIAMQDALLEEAKNADGTYDFAPMFSQITGVIGNADYTVANVEGALGDTEDPNGGSLMRTPSSLITVLKDNGVDMLNLANDHSLDSYFDGLKATIQNCVNAGMNYVGAASSLAEKETPKIVEMNGIKVGFVSYTDTVNGMEEKSNDDAVKYGINLINRKTNPEGDIEACRAAGADVVVAYMSWGEMFSREMNDDQKEMAQILAEAGADVIIGYNPHVIQPASWIEITDKEGNVTHRTLCLGAPGNFLSAATEDNSNTGIIFQFTIQEKEDLNGFEITNPSYVPTVVWATENEDGSTSHRTLAVGQWLETAPEGMGYAESSRLKEVWATVQGYMGTGVATVVAE